MVVRWETEVAEGGLVELKLLDSFLGLDDDQVEVGCGVSNKSSGVVDAHLCEGELLLSEHELLLRLGSFSDKALMSCEVLGDGDVQKSDFSLILTEDACLDECWLLLWLRVDAFHVTEFW